MTTEDLEFHRPNMCFECEKDWISWGVRAPSADTAPYLKDTDALETGAGGSVS